MSECIISLIDIKAWYEKLFDTLGIDYWLVTLDPLDGNVNDPYPFTGHYTFYASLTCTDPIEDLLRESHIWFRRCD